VLVCVFENCIIARNSVGLKACGADGTLGFPYLVPSAGGEKVDRLLSAALNGSVQVPDVADPVFVLCMGRSGSTLLRFLLDAHPDLACPPETSLPSLCGQLAVVWSLIEGAPLSRNRGDAPPQVPDGAVAGIRHMVDMMTGSYLARRAKRRFCDKSLGSARFAGLLLRVYPEAKFICLYRHPMDMIRSGIEACPWGLNGYGFDQYIGVSPGNEVHALARYWLDNASPIAAFEEEHPDRCHRVRYEDLVTDPERAAREVYEFIGVPDVPGITRDCFSPERERFGPADYKIWATSEITADSVGKGESIPAGLIPPPVTEAINELMGKLGYRAIDEEWGTPGMPADPRLPETVPDARERRPTVGGETAASDGAVAGTGLAERLRAGLGQAGDRLADRWQEVAVGRFLVVIRAPGTGGGESGWLVDLDARTVTVADDGDADPDDADWNILGSPETWDAVLSGRVNLHVALRRCDLRYCSAGEDVPFDADARIAMLVDLLGFSSWIPARRHGHASAAPIPAAAG
jgi:protein-tyrosine sulfotransferase